jgi:hypothetical protein
VSSIAHIQPKSNALFETLNLAMASARRSAFVRVFSEDAVMMSISQSRHSLRCAFATSHAACCLGESLFISVSEADHFSSLALQATVGLRIDGAKIAPVPGTEPQLVVFCEILEARVHPVDADPRFLKILLTTRLVEIRCNSRKFSRDNLFCSSG